MEKNDFIRLKHMLEAAHTCLQLGQGKLRIDLETDQMFSFAVIRTLEIFGEAASRVSNDFQMLTLISLDEQLSGCIID